MFMNKSKYFLTKGVTLIELIVSIVIITIAVGGIMALFLGTTSTSADPMIRAQSLAIAQSYMDEIMMQPYSISTNTSDSGTCNDGDSPEKSERAKYNDLSDYHNLSDIGAHNQNGCLIDALNAYTVDVSIVLTTLNTVVSKKITVTVTHSGLGTVVPLIAYRTDY